MSRLKLASIIGLIGGPAFAFMGFKEKQKIENIEKNGVEVAGIPVSGNLKKGRRGAKTYTLNVEYLDSKGAPRSKDFKVTGDFFESISTGDEITADTVPLKVLPDQPDQAIIIGGSDDDRLMFPVGIGAFVLGGIGTVFAFRKPR
jgi:hypothetical protein